MGKSRTSRRPEPHRARPPATPIRPVIDQVPAVAVAVLDDAVVRDDEKKLRDLADAVDSARGDLHAAVLAARRAGMSWHRIGLAVHLTAEGARRRWGGSS